MTRLRDLLGSKSSGKSSLPNITHGSRQQWTLIGPGNQHLLDALERLYWQGVEREIENIVRTLRTWQRPENADVSVEDEEDDHIHGFDTFLDQVSQEAREYAIRYGEKKARGNQLQDVTSGNVEYEEAVKMVEKNRSSEHHRIKIKSEVKEKLLDVSRLCGIEQRANMLLQAAGFLDIDKLIEHRPPLEDLGFWARPAIPQLTLSRFDKDWNPQFVPMKCSKCSATIRGSMFINKSHKKTICEECYRLHFYGNRLYKKSYKHCILLESITPGVDQNLCHCEGVSRYHSDQGTPGLFPVAKEEPHMRNAAIPCKLLELGDQVSIAKYQGLVASVQPDDERPSMMRSILGSVRRTHGRGERNRIDKAPVKLVGSKGLPIQNVPHKQVPMAGSTTAATEAQADEDIPVFFRQFTQQYPFGNVHMALRIGPLVIENGVSNTKGGSLISLRELPVFHDQFKRSRQPSLAVGGDPERSLWQQERLIETPKRYKAVMKQVIGAPFTSILTDFESQQESEIIDLIVAASHKPFDNPGLPATDQTRMLNTAIQPILAVLKTLLAPRLNIYLKSIASRLLDPLTALTWSATGNNCQNFCNSLINLDIFEPLVRAPEPFPDQSPSPLYLMSFVCPQEGYARSNVKTKFDVPKGLTEEYLLRFHFGRHDEADILDTLHEYWHDWGAFNGPLYKYQHLFPWDCTEAYGRYPTKCGACNLAKHIWAFPFDAWSIIMLHLHRDQNLYPPSPPPSTSQSPTSTPQSWMRDRLTILTAFSLLTRGAAAMTKAAEFRTATAWLHAPAKALRKVDPSLVRTKLGGIHRAQPYSHYYEAGRYKHFFLARWAIRPRPEQIVEYEALRDARQGMADVGDGQRGEAEVDAEAGREGERVFAFEGFEGIDGVVGLGDGGKSEDGDGDGGLDKSGVGSEGNLRDDGARPADHETTTTASHQSGHGDQIKSYSSGYKSHSYSDHAATSTADGSTASSSGGGGGGHSTYSGAQIKSYSSGYKSHTHDDHLPTSTAKGSTASYSGGGGGGHSSYSGGYARSSYSGGYTSSSYSGGGYSRGYSSSGGGGSSSYSSGGGGGGGGGSSYSSGGDYGGSSSYNY